MSKLAATKEPLIRLQKGCFGRWPVEAWAHAAVIRRFERDHESGNLTALPLPTKAYRQA